jgi:acetyl-CoA acyltransferase 1
MGVGPSAAIPMLLQSTALTIPEVDLWEINEAFASQALYCIRALGLDMDKMNPKGGAIALGHPLEPTGARQLATMLPEMKRQGKEVRVVSMCVGTVRNSFYVYHVSRSY